MSVAGGALTVAVPTTKPGGRGEDTLLVVLTPAEQKAIGNIEAIGR